MTAVDTTDLRIVLLFLLPMLDTQHTFFDVLMSADFVLLLLKVVEMRESGYQLQILGVSDATAHTILFINVSNDTLSNHTFCVSRAFLKTS